MALAPLKGALLLPRIGTIFLEVNAPPLSCRELNRQWRHTASAVSASLTNLTATLIASSPSLPPVRHVPVVRQASGFVQAGFCSQPLPTSRSRTANGTETQRLRTVANFPGTGICRKLGSPHFICSGLFQASSARK